VQLDFTAAIYERFWAKVDTSGACWEWTACVSPEGYGRFSLGRQPRYAHRVAWAMIVGLPPVGLDLDHLCRNRLCVNPEHLEVVTRSVNLKRGAVARGRVTQCHRGHPYDKANTYVNARGHIECRICRLANQVARRNRLRARGERVT